MSSSSETFMESAGKSD